MTQHTRIGLLVAFVILAGATWASFLYGYPNIGNATEIQGTVKVISAYPPYALRIQTTFGRVYTVPISEDTKIERRAPILGVQTGGGVQVATTEVNISDVSLGASITAHFDSKTRNTLVGVHTIDIAGLATSPSSKEDSFTSAKITKVDIKKQLIEYGITLPNAPKPLTFTLGTAGLPVFSVTDPLRAQILHARMPATLSDLKVGDAVVIHFRTTATLPQAVEIVLIKNK